MSKKVKGVKHIKDDVYLIDYQVGLDRHQERVNAASMSVARAIRDERRVVACHKELWRKLFVFIKRDRPHYYYPLYYAFRTGRRITETLMLEKRDVVWDGLNPVRINIRAETTKMKAAAPMLTLDEDLRKTIKESIQRNRGIKTKHLFPNEKGKMCKYDRVRLYLRKVSPPILGVEIKPHHLRLRYFSRAKGRKKTNG